jgi:hypothetical protein
MPARSLALGHLGIKPPERRAFGSAQSCMHHQAFTVPLPDRTSYDGSKTLN